ncbi:MAG TPA: type VI secretion system baseplate subunit TssF [Longimicrobium sp.]
MRDALLDYYERELTWLRRTGADFARRYPRVAQRLLLEPTKCEDPHVERLLEGFAFLAARVHLKLDDDFPEIAEALLDAAYPQYVRPIPSMAVAQLHPDPERGALPAGHPVPRGTLLYSREVAGAPCRFRTCYDTALLPVSVASAKWTAPYELRPPVRAGDAVAAIRLELRCLGGLTFSALETDSLRFHLSAEPNLAGTLYELLCNSVREVWVRDLVPGSRAEPVVLPAGAITPVGFAEDEGMLPVPRRAFVGYRLLGEYFTFPEKFWFVDLAGFERVRAAGMGEAVEVVILIAPFERGDRRNALEAGIGAETFRLGCTPIINLFPHTSEPTPVTQRAFEYRIIPDAHRPTTGVYAVEEVTAVAAGDPTPLRIEPLHAFRARGDGVDEAKVWWYARRRPSGWRPDEATDVCLHFVDRDARLAQPYAHAVTARLLCHNGDLPGRMELASDGADLSLPGGGPVLKVSLLGTPTPLVQPPSGGAQLWRLVSQLSLNYASLADDGAESLRALLALHNFAGSRAGEKHVQGVVSVAGAPMHARVGGEGGIAFARGHRVEVTFDEEEFAGGGVYLLAAVLERFMGLYVSMNSFCALTARTRQRREPLRRWPPRSGWKPLL